MANRQARLGPGGSIFAVAPTPQGLRHLESRPRRPARHLLDRVRGEFTELQGFSPTLDQAARLFSLSRDECHRVFNQLLRDGFLGRSADGRYRLNPPRS